MNKREFAKLKRWTDTLTDEELKKEYYDAVFDALGSQAEEMYERGYDEVDMIGGIAHIKCSEEQYKSFCDSELMEAPKILEVKLEQRRIK